MRIAIIGTGKVGFAAGRGFSKFDNDVVFFDINKEVLKKIRKQGYKTTDSLDSIANDYKVFVFCLPTPTKNGKIDLSIMKSGIKQISKLLKNRKKYFLMIIKSTIVPTTTDEDIIPIIEKYSGKKVGKDFGICYNPEFLRERYAYQDFLKPDRIIIGEYDKKSGNILKKLYKPFKTPILRTDLRTAEMVKYANNCFYATKISFFNEFHIVCKKLGINSNFVRKAVQMDKFYSTHPWSHGKKFGGNCLPKDLKAFIGFCSKNHIHNPVLLNAVWKVNEKIEL